MMQGLRGFVKGAGKGLVGLALKPAAGMLDLASRTMEGFANTFEYVEDARGATHERASDPRERMRLPRMLYGQEGAIYPYSNDAAVARIVLQSLRAGVYLREPLLLCKMLSEGEVVLLTANRLLLAATKCSGVL